MAQSNKYQYQPAADAAAAPSPMSAMIVEEEEPAAAAATRCKSSSSIVSRTWKICGQEYSKECITYIGRCLMLHLLAAASIINLSLGIAPQEVWLMALIVSMGGMGIAMAVPAVNAASAATAATAAAANATNAANSSNNKIVNR